MIELRFYKSSNECTVFAFFLNPNAYKAEFSGASGVAPYLPIDSKWQIVLYEKSLRFRIGYFQLILKFAKCISFETYIYICKRRLIY